VANLFGKVDARKSPAREAGGRALGKEAAGG